MKDQRPILAITMGDPAGVGPEIIAHALACESVWKKARPLVVGSADILRKAVELTGVALQVKAIEQVADACIDGKTLNVIDLWHLKSEAVPQRQVSSTAGEASVLAIKEAIRLAMLGEVDATVTAPINKEAIRAAACPHVGHTELYATETDAQHSTMLLAHGNLRVVHVSTHVSLRVACDRVKTARVLEVIELAQQACKSFGIEQPSVAVAGLNPHSGENGLFGREEIEEIAPAVVQACEKGIQAFGPIPPDTVFSKAVGGLYDIVVAMYHDQGHIPLKMAGFQFDAKSGVCQAAGGVNITLGLPIIRTSVDHGTAFDIAWKNKAAHDSLLEAIDYAVRMAKNRK